MSPMQRFEHAITVRNRTLGPGKATTVSSYLNVEVSQDNKRFLALKPDDINMHRVLQESMCKHGFRRKVAKRTLNALGTASGMCGVLNDAEEVEKLKSNLKFAASLEEVRHSERQRKQAKAKQKAQEKVAADAARAKRAREKLLKMEELVRSARKKLGISESTPFNSSHVSELSSTMLSAIAFCCFKVKLAGKVDEKRKKLVELLGPGDETEEGQTGSETEEEKTEAEGDTPFDQLNVSDIVEVYWSGSRER